MPTSASAGIGAPLVGLGNDHQGNVCTATRSELETWKMGRPSTREPVISTKIRNPDSSLFTRPVATQEGLRRYIVTDTLPAPSASSSSPWSALDMYSMYLVARSIPVCAKRVRYGLHAWAKVIGLKPVTTHSLCSSAAPRLCENETVKG